MKGRVFAVLLVVFMAAAVGVVIGVVAGGNGAPKNAPMPPNIIVVDGSASVSTAPDQASVRVGVSSEAATAEDALKANAEKADAVIKSLSDNGIADKDVQTNDVGVNRHIEDRGTPKETTFFRATESFSVTIHDLEKVGDIIDSAVAAGANSVGGVEFTLSDSSNAKNDALKKAVVNAHSKAVALAAASGATVGAVVRIDEQGSDVQPYYARNDAFMGALPMAAPSTIVSPGQVETSVSVRVTYELIPS